MAQQDLTSDMLTRIRNAVRNQARDVKCLNNRLNRGVLQVLVDEGYIVSYDPVDDGRGGFIKVQLKYGPRGEKLINSIDRASKPGCRVYRGAEDLPRPVQGLGIAVVSTSRGVMSDRRCRKERIGGEVVAIIS